MKLRLSGLRLALSLTLAMTAAMAADPAPAATAGHPQLGSFGIDLSARDLSVKPGDDFNRYASGHWIASYQLKADEASYGSFNALRDQADEQVRGLIEGLQSRADLAPGSNAQKIRDLYASYMNRSARDAAGITPLRPVLDRIAAIDSKAALIEAFGRAAVDGSDAPFGLYVGTDRKNPDRYQVGLGVGGLGLPDRDY